MVVSILLGCLAGWNLPLDVKSGGDRLLPFCALGGTENLALTAEAGAGAGVALLLAGMFSLDWAPSKLNVYSAAAVALIYDAVGVILALVK